MSFSSADQKPVGNMRLLTPYFLLMLFISTCWMAYAEEEEEEADKKKSEVGTVIGIDLGTTYSWLVTKFSFSF